MVKAYFYSHAHWLLAVASVVFCADWDCTARAAVTDKEAIEIANHLVSSLGKEVRSFEAEIDRGEEWRAYREFIRRQGQTEESRNRFAAIDERLKGKTHWTIYYYLRRELGHFIVDGDVLVFVDDRTGEVLEVLVSGVSKK